MSLKTCELAGCEAPSGMSSPLSQIARRTGTSSPPSLHSSTNARNTPSTLTSTTLTSSTLATGASSRCIVETRAEDRGEPGCYSWGWI